MVEGIRERKRPVEPFPEDHKQSDHRQVEKSRDPRIYGNCAETAAARFAAQAFHQRNERKARETEQGGQPRPLSADISNQNECEENLSDDHGHQQIAVIKQFEQPREDTALQWSGRKLIGFQPSGGEQDHCDDETESGTTKASGDVCFFLHSLSFSTRPTQGGNTSNTQILANPGIFRNHLISCFRMSVNRPIAAKNYTVHSH